MTTFNSKRRMSIAVPSQRHGSRIWSGDDRSLTHSPRALARNSLKVFQGALEAFISKFHDILRELYDSGLYEK